MGCTYHSNQSKIIVPSMWENDGKFDPHSIKFAYQASIAKALFSPLITINDDGEYTSMLADNFYWDSNYLVFEFIEPKFKSNGEEITVDEIYNSIRIQSEKHNSLHGNLKSMLVNESIESIIMDKNKIKLHFLAKRKSSGLQYFVNTEALILPKEVYSLNREMKFADFRVTTGPYSLKSYADNLIILTANLKHKLYSDKMPQEVHLEKGHLINDLYDRLMEREDFIIPGYRSIENRPFFKKIQKGFNIWASHPIKLHHLVFTESGVKDINLKRRFIIADRFKRIFDLSKIIKPFYFFFLDGTLGELSKEDKKEVLKFRDLPEVDFELGEGLAHYYTNENLVKIYKEILVENEVFPKMNISKTSVSSSYPFYFEVVDTSFTDDFGLINYFLGNVCELDLDKKTELINQYLENESSKDKQALISKEHKKCLLRGKRIPVALAPYYIISHKKWKIEKNKFFGDTPFWRFRLNQEI